MMRIKISYFIIALLIISNILSSVKYTINKNDQNEKCKLRMNEINDFWINELKNKDSIFLHLSTSELRNIILFDTVKNRDVSLFIFIPEDACWECAKSKLELINNMRFKMNIELYCPSGIKRRIVLLIKENEFKDANISSIINLKSDYHSKEFYFAFKKGNSVSFFVDILSTNELLKGFLNQIKRYDNT